MSVVVIFILNLYILEFIFGHPSMFNRYLSLMETIVLINGLDI